MLGIYDIAAGINLAICLTLGSLTKSKAASQVPKGFSSHLFRYLTAWTFCIGGEWLGGPGVYALYSSYGFDRRQIAVLFVLGFAFGSVFGLFAGKFADTFGRKRSVLTFCSVGVIAVACKHVSIYPILLVGRFFDGIHASLLYTAFESWLVSEHFGRHSFPPELLGHTFALMFSISYLVAIACGFVAQFGVDMFPTLPPMASMHFGGWTVPLELSAFLQVIGGIYVALNWDENYGATAASNAVDDSSSGPSLMKVLCSLKVLVCCALVSFFESSMFIFVFSWTPALSPTGKKDGLPCGLIFATYMMACMSGAAAFSLSSKFKVTGVMCVIAFLAFCAMAVPSIVGVSQDAANLNFMAFLLFEFSVGAYFPAAAHLKGMLVPEQYRATIYNVFRTPMNAIVVLVLLTGPSLHLTFSILCSMLFFASVIMVAFYFSQSSEDPKEEPLLCGKDIRSGSKTIERLRTWSA
eukprot:TRINITY_DN22104_c0_g4_i1.p1 TRINITY_DN22104_c0_g4~~TRINITY_DN22104_c0_g4_i1.p1  ORF type:complete len:466 (-),score=45.59 TRINITY_DN22104_c0_g4_i1:419-1816(-)